MKSFSHKLKPAELTAGLEGHLLEQREVILSNVSELGEANEHSVCFYEDSKFLKELADLNAGLVIVPVDFDVNLLPETNLFFSSRPYLSLNNMVSRWLELEKERKERAIDPTAMIAEDVLLGEKVDIGPYVVIGRGVTIGNKTVIGANTVIGEQVSIGEDCRIYPNVTIYQESEIGNRVFLHAGAVIGMDGFGYLQVEGEHNKINHIGRVIIEDEVEIGANSCIDRATFGVTRIGTGTKIDNLVQIGHNCRLGKNVILCAQVGLAGNTEVGNNVFLAGQVGAAGHLKINDGAMVGAQSGISSDVPAGKKYFGTPAIEASLQKRIIVALRRLPEILSFFNKLVRKQEKSAEKQD